MRVKRLAQIPALSKTESQTWIKLYRELLDDLEWFKLSGDDSQGLVMLWLLASEDETAQAATLPDVQTMCFRLRIEEKQLNQHLINLSEWLEQDASTAASRLLSALLA